MAATAQGRTRSVRCELGSGRAISNCWQLRCRRLLFCGARRGDSSWNSRHLIVHDYWLEAVRAAETSSLVQRIDDHYRLNALREAIIAAGIDSSNDGAATVIAKRFEWRDFSVGMVAAASSLLALVILGANIFGFRLSRGRTPADSSA